jgi:hypothetical protein
MRVRRRQSRHSAAHPAHVNAYVGHWSVVEGVIRCTTDVALLETLLQHGAELDDAEEWITDRWKSANYCYGEITALEKMTQLLAAKGVKFSPWTLYNATYALSNNGDDSSPAQLAQLLACVLDAMVVKGGCIADDATTTREVVIHSECVRSLCCSDKRLALYGDGP